MEETLLNLMKLSPVVAVLIFIVWQQGKRIDRHEEASTTRETTMRAECTDRETRLAMRLTELEERQHREGASLLATSAEATKTFARALDRWVDREDVGSGKHRARE
jgi:hypothetical protein